MHLLITILRDVWEHELVCNKPMIVCHQDQKRMKSAELCAMSFDFYIDHCIYMIYLKNSGHTLSFNTNNVYMRLCK